MNKSLLVCRSASDDYANFSLLLYPQHLDMVVLEYKNHFTKQKEKLANTDLLLEHIHATLQKLESCLEDEQTFKAELEKLPNSHQQAFEVLFKTIYFESEETYYLLDLLNALEQAKEAGFFDNLKTITEIKNPKAWSSWSVSTSDGVYQLSGVVEKPEYIDFTCTKRTAENGENVVFSWDNPPFLYQYVYPILQEAYSYANQLIDAPDNKMEFPADFWEKLDKSKMEVAERILNDIPAQDWAFVYEMILEAQKVGFWQLYLHRNIAQTLENITEIADFYQKETPEYFKSNQIKAASSTQIEELEEKLGEKLPADYKAFLENNTLGFDFDGNFRVLSIVEVLKNWQSMGELLDKGVFDDGRIEHHMKENFGNWDGDYIQKVWWSKKWIPFAEDGCGNMKCIDLDPSENGRTYQLISMEIQDGQGPFVLGKYEDFADYLAKHLQYLKKGQYTLADYHTGKMIEVDSYIKPK